MKAFVSVSFVLLCASVLAAPVAKLDSLLVYGEGFMFSVKEPAGWVADTQHAAAYQANVLVYEKSSTWKQSDSLIRVRITDKVDEHVESDLAADMDGYKKDYPNVQFKNFVASNPKYRTYPKLFFVPNQFYEYVTYVNPGPSSPLMFSVAMSTHTNEATKEQLTAFDNVVSSLIMLKKPQQGAPAERPLLNLAADLRR
ncbi:hypothetical protein [Dyella sp. S184]|uniref:hypothetical protein n=1 Tax=Dyella sp. S184 TaxID=1641862 RepID=UPI00131EB45C|nr:hypothetical protein [Dyella sp. S184]